MELQELLSKLNDGKLPPPADKKKWEEDSDRISIHAKGIRPRFENPRKGKAGRLTNSGVVTPANYEERYQYLFDSYILSRHPNEQDEHYQFRLSVYPLLAQEVYLNGKAQIGGSIFQTSQYTIAGSDEQSQMVIDDLDFETRLKEQWLEFILTDPYGKFAVVEKHFDEFGTDEPPITDIELVESRYIMHYEPKESILFQAQQMIDGRKVLYFLDRNFCVKLIQVEKRTKQYQVLTTYAHNLGVLPIVDNNKYLFKPFVTWADLIARNFSDDEIVAKNNNYPHIQMVESICDECMGSCVKAYECETCEGGIQEESCRKCNGRGTISVNPGEIHVIKESEFRPGEMGGSQGMIDRIKFINPDVSISKNSLERCRYIYEMGLKSLHLKHTEEAQSGTAKAIDREQLYLLISTCSDHIFNIADKLLMLVFGYVQLGIATNKPYILEKPTQFQIKTESDIQEELKELAGADISVRRQKTNEYMEVVYSGNKIELKKWGIIRVWDTLYCMTPDEITMSKLNNGVTDTDVMKHAQGERLLNMMILEKTPEWFINARPLEIVAELDRMIAEITPAPRVKVPEIV